MMAFISGGAAAVAAGTMFSAPFANFPSPWEPSSLVSFMLAMFILEWGPVAELGEGGVERWIVYPVILWLTMFGGTLMAQAGAAGTRTRAPEAG